MIKKLITAVLPLLLMAESIYALDLSVQPRFKTGIQYYEYEQKAFQSLPRDPERQFPNMLSSLEYKDWLPYVSGGLTVFADRFFVDFDVQHAFDGHDQTDSSQQAFIIGDSVDTLLRFNNSNDTEFERTEWSVSLGFTVIENLVVFGGYKNAETEFDVNMRGDVDITIFRAGDPAPPIGGPFTGKLEQSFEYDGPFVGAAYSWKIKQGFVDGALAFKFAAAFLDGSVDVNFRDIVIGNQPFDLQNLRESGGRSALSTLEGDSTGFSLGASWRGLTPIDGLTYSAGIIGYYYEFDIDTSAEFNETQVRLDFGVAYTFGM